MRKEWKKQKREDKKKKKEWKREKEELLACMELLKGEVAKLKKCKEEIDGEGDREKVKSVMVQRTDRKAWSERLGKKRSATDVRDENQEDEVVYARSKWREMESEVEAEQEVNTRKRYGLVIMKEKNWPKGETLDNFLMKELNSEKGWHTEDCYNEEVKKVFFKDLELKWNLWEKKRELGEAEIISMDPILSRREREIRNEMVRAAKRIREETSKENRSDIIKAQRDGVYIGEH